MKNIDRWVINSALVVALCFVMACQNNRENKLQNDAVKKENPSFQKPETKPKTQKIAALTDENVVEDLTRYGNQNPETLVRLKTSKGDMVIKLYENTPLHRANLIRLIKNNFYKGTEFYRVINEFMIQGGDADGWERQGIKEKMGKYTLPAEFRTENIHQKGAVAMSREYKNNPEKRSVSFDFFIVQGTVYSEGEIRGAEQTYDLKISPEHAKIYKTVGGCPHLDGQHTVFGQVIEGLDVIDKIAAVEVDEGNWPIEEVTMDFEIIK